MLSTLLSRYRAAWIVVLAFVILEVIVRLLPSEYGLPSGHFMAEYRKHHMEASEPCYDYIIFGDSRSLSLNGQKKNAERPFSIYNFSLPAMEPRYFVEYLRKYMRNRDCAPSALIFAGSPTYFEKGMTMPLNDQQGLYTTELDQNLADYIALRFSQRLEQPFQRPASKGGGQSELLWEAFSHRLLYTFDPWELAEMYRGPERVFAIRESLPLLYSTYKYRDAVRNYTIGIKKAHFEEPGFPDICNECEGIEKLPMCHPSLTDVQDNRRMATVLDRNQGGLNITDRLKPFERIAYEQMRTRAIEDAVKIANRPEIEIDITPIRNLAKEAKKWNIPLAIIVVPFPEEYVQTRIVRLYLEAVRKLETESPDVRYFSFPKLGYSDNLFAEGTHYTCPGAMRANDEFMNKVVPEIRRFAAARN
ncbi:MAG: hypothetical protein KDK33_05475 [Leptospiraceae bacterium]|nr:hypothetical protein [Leptospiraceae bacterium]